MKTVYYDIIISHFVFNRHIYALSTSEVEPVLIVKIQISSISGVQTPHSSITSVSFQRFTQKMVVLKKILYAIAMISLYLGAGACFFMALSEFYKSYTYVSRQCRVNSVDIKRYDKKYKGVWKVTIMDEDKRRDVLVAELVHSISREEDQHKVLFHFSTFKR